MSTPVYVLSADDRLHKNDVRCVKWFGQSIYSASRDATAAVHCPPMSSIVDSCAGDLAPGWIFQGHQAFVNFVMVHPSLPLLDGETAVITGSNDKHVIIWSVETGAMEAVLDAHSEGVRCGIVPRLGGVSKDFVTGGWDKLCVVWDGVSAKAKQVFDGHKSSVLCVAQLTESVMLSSSGDKTVLAWDIHTAHTIHMFAGHTDAVQAVVAITPDLFASAGNDGMIFVWSLSCRSSVNAFAAHDHLVYGLAYRPASDLLVSSSEDHTVKLWRDVPNPSSAESGPLQVLVHPCVVWSVDIDEQSGDIATGGSDGIVRLWTADDSRLAPIEKLEALEVAITSQQIDVKAAAAATDQLPDVATMPDVDSLHLLKGKKEGEKKFFRNGSLVEVYVWNQGSWTKMGVVVSGPEKAPYTGAPPAREKIYYNGKQVDYLFDVEVDKRSLKLPYTRGQNIFDAAQDFINEHSHLGVSQESKEAIVQHILKLIDPADAALIGVSSGASGTAAGDVAFSEFAREAAEMRSRGQQHAQSWGEAKSKIEASGEDCAFSTFAQEGRALQQKGAANTSSTSTPATGGGTQWHEPEVFKTFNAAGASSKISQLVGSSDYDYLVTTCVALSTQSGSSDDASIRDVVENILALRAILPDGSQFPAVDLLRLVSLSQRVAHVLLADMDSVNSFASIASSSTSDIDRTVALRLWVNLISHKDLLPPTAAVYLQQYPVLLPLLRAGLRSTVANVRSAALAFVQNAALLLAASANSSGDSVDVMHEALKALIAVIAESVVFISAHQSDVILSLLRSAMTLKQISHPSLRSSASGKIAQFLGPSLRLLKSPGGTTSPALAALAEALAKEE